MISALTHFLLTILMFVACALLQYKKLTFIIILSSLFSLCMAMLFTVMQAPDVAMTEALVGGGMMTIIFLGTATGINILFRPVKNPALDAKDDNFLTNPLQNFARPHRSKFFVCCAVGVLLLLLLLLLDLLVQNLPMVGVMDLIGVHRFAMNYVQQTVDNTMFHNVVNAIVVSQRGFDTLVELCVILAAGLSIMLLLDISNIGGRISVTKNSIVYYTITLLVPVLLLFACYLFVKGEYAPGGGFQAGILLSIAITVHTLIHGAVDARRIYSVQTILLLLMAGVLLYLGSALAPIMFASGVFFETNTLPLFVNKLTGILSELGIMFVVFSTMILMFYSLVVHFVNKN